MEKLYWKNTKPWESDSHLTCGTGTCWMLGSKFSWEVWPGRAKDSVNQAGDQCDHDSPSVGCLILVLYYGSLQGFINNPHNWVDLASISSPDLGDHPITFQLADLWVSQTSCVSALRRSSLLHAGRKRWLERLRLTRTEAKATRCPEPLQMGPKWEFVREPTHSFPARNKALIRPNYLRDNGG